MDCMCAEETLNCLVILASAHACILLSVTVSGYGTCCRVFSTVSLILTEVTSWFVMCSIGPELCISLSLSVVNKETGHPDNIGPVFNSIHPLLIIVIITIITSQL